jgi:hypothetical protein
MGDRGALSGPLAGVAFIGGIAAGLAVADAPYPQPGAEPRAIKRYFRGSARAARISIAGQLVSAASLARFTGSVVGLASESGPGARRLQAAATAAGAVAVASLAVSALTSLALTGASARSNPTVVTMHRRVFVAGGPVHTAAFGVLVGCLALAGRRTGRLPAPLTTAGLASACAGALSPLGLVLEPAVLLVPAGRVSGLVVCGIAGARLSGPLPRPHR